MLKMRTFRRKRLSEWVLHEIEQMIAEEYPNPGCKLPKEADLAERYHVSRIVIREAMKILEDRGVVEVRAGRGTLTVAPKPDRVKELLLRLFNNHPIPTAEEMERLLEVRQVLEETAASLAAVRASEDDLVELEAALREMKKDGLALNETIAGDLRFHRGVTRAAHNRYFEMLLDPLTEVVLQQIKLTNAFKLGLEAHRAIFAEIRARNPVGARQAVRRLMKTTLSDCRRVLKDFNQP